MSWRRTQSSPRLEELKSILESIQRPEALNDHPWTKMRLVGEARARNPVSSDGGLGASLLGAISDVFMQMMPSVPPRRSLRLDTRWGEFGLLAARYFAPFRFGMPYPASLRDAWGRIDSSILLFVFGSVDGSVPAEQKARFTLVGNEAEVAPISTLSDWHTHGVRRLADLILKTETHSQQSDNGAGSAKEARHGMGASRPRKTAFARSGVMLLAAILVVLLVGTGLKAYRVYTLAGKLRSGLLALEQVSTKTPTREGFAQLGTQLEEFDGDLRALRKEVDPYLWLGPLMQWVPVYGGDLTQAQDLLDLAGHMTTSAQEAEAAAAMLAEASSTDSKIALSDIGTLLWEARPQLVLARSEAQAAAAARGRIDSAGLSPDVRRLLTQRLDPVMEWWTDGLSLAIALPAVIGAGDVGPRTYLILVQNEDELRPSGGFITAVGKAVLDQGRVVDLYFEDSGDLDNWAMPYPMAPWQLSQYMNSRVLVLRDANWFSDFPLAGLYVKQLYAYTHQNSVNGIVALDQQLLVRLLRTVGPLQVADAPQPITADNVVDYMRSAKSPPPGQPVPQGWTRKGFIGTLAEALLQEVSNGTPQEWSDLAATLLQAVDEHHVLLLSDDPDAAPVLAGRHWNGALQSESGDFLMVVDSNVGFNKTNAVVQTSLAYDVHLTDLENPVGELSVNHANQARADVPCIQWDAGEVIPGESDYPIDRCYWDYMRIYTAAGTRLLSGTPQSIPRAWMILNRTVSPTIDVLEEGLSGIQGFGTPIVVPGGQSVNTSLRFALPGARILSESPGKPVIYRLTVRKQPGTLAIPLTLRIHLPTGAVPLAPSPDWTVQGSNILIDTDLRVDLHLEVAFRRR